MYNGERYLEEALDSVLNQTFDDYELVIADNASTDNTPQICSSYASADTRVRYIRHESNIGGSRNFNFVFSQARSPYFKWLAHDDICRPEFVGRCVEALEANPSVVLAYPQSFDISANGDMLRLRDTGLDITSRSPYERFRDLIIQPHGALSLFGVVRTEVLAATRRMGGYYGSDRPLLGELALRGPFIEVPDVLFLRRQHDDRSVRANASSRGIPEWFKPGAKHPLALPTWERLGDYLVRIHRSPISARERTRCYVLMARWMYGKRMDLWRDVVARLDRWRRGHG